MLAIRTTTTGSRNARNLEADDGKQVYHEQQQNKHVDNHRHCVKDTFDQDAKRWYEASQKLRLRQPS
jgi:hypothetical protein